MVRLHTTIVHHVYRDYDEAVEREAEACCGEEKESPACSLARAEARHARDRLIAAVRELNE